MSTPKRTETPAKEPYVVPVMQDRQEAFTYVVRKLRERGWTKAVTETTYKDADGVEHTEVTCSYRSPVGPCAVGILVNDDELPEDAAGIVSRLIHTYGVKFKSLPWLNLSNTGMYSDMFFLKQMQVAHDRSDAFVSMEVRFRTMAQLFKLNFPED